MAKEMPRGENKPLDPVSLATWARLRSAGKIAKPNGAERMSENGAKKNGKKKNGKKKRP